MTIRINVTSIVIVNTESIVKDTIVVHRAHADTLKDTGGNGDIHLGDSRYECSQLHSHAHMIVM